MIMTPQKTHHSYMLDTNTASYIIKGNPPTVRERLKNIPVANICISAITQAELLLGVSRKPEAKRLMATVQAFMLNVEILAWTSDAAKTYAQLRSDCERKGTTLSSMDMLIAAHALSVSAVLVTSDKAFSKVGMFLTLEDWTLPNQGT